jgi:NAD(P)-dependent dehydrogenase (short-subunit alcohol dehydrogenase family)
MKMLEDKVVIVAGASSGIGRAATLLFAGGVSINRG